VSSRRCKLAMGGWISRAPTYMAACECVACLPRRLHDGASAVHMRHLTVSHLQNYLNMSSAGWTTMHQTWLERGRRRGCCTTCRPRCVLCLLRCACCAAHAMHAVCPAGSGQTMRLLYRYITRFTCWRGGTGSSCCTEPWAALLRVQHYARLCAP